MVAAAQVAQAGLDPIAFLRTKNSFLRNVMQSVAHETLKLEQRRDLDRARVYAFETIKALSEAFKKKG